jgi:hypothetical protein
MLPLVRRKAVLKRLAGGARRWIALTEPGRRLFELVAELDLARGVVAKRLADPCALGRYDLVNRPKVGSPLPGLFRISDHVLTRRRWAAKSQADRMFAGLSQH